MGFLSNAPRGFSDAVSALNSLPQGVLAELCQDVIAFLQYQAGFINTVNYDLTLSTLQLETQVDAQTCINALTFVFRSAALEGMSVDALVAELKASLEWGEGVLAVVKHVWKEEGPALCSLPKEALSVGQLVSTEWKLGVAVSSNSCKSLNSPYISLQLRTAESAGKSQLHTIDMTVSEFQNFAAQLKDMASSLDTAA